MNKYEIFRRENDIVELIESHGVPLHRVDKPPFSRYVGTCPFHDDYKRSLMVCANRQLWRCQVCDIGGDAWGFDNKMNRRFFDDEDTEGDEEEEIGA